MTAIPQPRRHVLCSKCFGVTIPQFPDGTWGRCRDANCLADPPQQTAPPETHSPKGTHEPNIVTANR